MGDNKYIFITGAASGIGRATAIRFASGGWMVAAADPDKAGLGSLRSELGGDQCSVYPLDVTDAEMFEAVIAEFADWSGGRLDVLYNNAGIGHSGWFEDVPYEDTRRLIDINFVGVVNGIYAALPLLSSTPNSLCFTTSSSSATYGIPRLAIYAATKFAVKGLTEALSIEFDRHGVRAADVLPGLIDTPLLDATPNHSGSAEDGILSRRRIATDGPFRLIEPDEIAECVWSAYHDETGRLHWYVPEELAELEAAKGSDLASVRAMLREATLNRPS